MLWVSGHLKYLILILSVSLESDISRRQILKYKDSTRAEKVNIGMESWNTRTYVAIKKVDIAMPTWFQRRPKHVKHVYFTSQPSTRMLPVARSCDNDNIRAPLSHGVWEPTCV